MARWCESVGPSQKLEKSAFEDIRWVTVDGMTGMDTPLTNDVTWKGKSWSRKSTRIGVLGIVVICMLLSAIVALAVLLYESRNDHPLRAASISEGVHDIPNAELMRRSNDTHSEYATTGGKEISPSESSKTKEIEEAIMENAMSNGREDMSTTSTKENEETPTANPNSSENKDSSAEMTIKPNNQESTSGSEHAETSTESPQVSQELPKEELQSAKDFVKQMNLSSNDTAPLAVTEIKVKWEIIIDPDYDELSEIDFGNTSEVTFGEESEMGYDTASEVENDYNEDEYEGLFDDSVKQMNLTSNDTLVEVVITDIEVKVEFISDPDYDELSEIDFGNTSEVTFGEESELGSEMENNYNEEEDEDEDEDEGLFEDSGDSTLLEEDLEMVPRSEWGGVAPRFVNLHPEPNPYVVITQTNSAPCFDQDSCSLAMKLIQSFSIKADNLPDMCDNYYIGGDGKVYVGRGPNVTNCHIGFVRLKNIGISFIGDFEKYEPTVFQVKALEKLISVLVSQHVLTRDYKIIAHKEINLPVSLYMGPGKYLLDKINSMPHRCSYSCIDDIVSSDYDDDSSYSNIIFRKYFD